jgi:hypothetical protein
VCVLCGSTRVWTQGLVLAGQALYHLHRPTHPFCTDCFGDKSTFLSRLSWTLILFVLPRIAEVTGVCHHAQVVVELNLSNFLPGLALNGEPPDLHLLSN